MKWVGQHIYDYVATFRQGVTMDSTLAVTGNTALSGNLTFNSVALTGIQTSAESFVNDDISIMTSAAIEDKILAYGYSTTAGDITGVVLTADDSNTVSDTGGSADFTITGANGIATTVDGTDFVIGGINASTSAKGVASFNSNDFTDSSGAISLKNITVSSDDILITQSTADKDIIFKCDDGNGGEITTFFIDGSAATYSGGANTAQFTNWVDNSKIALGTGQDMWLWHSGTHSYIDNWVGDLYIRQGTDDGDMLFQCDDGSGGLATYFFLDGSNANGSKITNWPDNSVITMGSANDWQMRHNGTKTNLDNYVGDVQIRNYANDKDITLSTDNGSGGLDVYLTCDGGDEKVTVNKKLEARLMNQLQFTFHNFTDDIDTTKIYLSLADADTEGTVTTAIKIPFTAPLAGKLMRIYLKANQNHSGNTLTWRLETQAAGVTFGTGPTVVGTQSGAGPTISSMTTYDFTSSLDSGDNIIDAGDSVYLSIQSNNATANTKFHVTCLWEWDFSSIG